VPVEEPSTASEADIAACEQLLAAALKPYREGAAILLKNKRIGSNANCNRIATNAPNVHATMATHPEYRSCT
jgi:hypothetical protein